MFGSTSFATWLDPGLEIAHPDGSSKNAGGGGRFSKLPIDAAALVIEDVLLIGGGGLLLCMLPLRSRVLRKVPMVFIAK